MTTSWVSDSPKLSRRRKHLLPCNLAWHKLDEWSIQSVYSRSLPPSNDLVISEDIIGYSKRLEGYQHAHEQRKNRLIFMCPKQAYRKEYVLTGLEVIRELQNGFFSNLPVSHNVIVDMLRSMSRAKTGRARACIARSSSKLCVRNGNQHS